MNSSINKSTLNALGDYKAWLAKSELFTASSKDEKQEMVSTLSAFEKHLSTNRVTLAFEQLVEHMFAVNMDTDEMVDEFSELYSEVSRLKDNVLELSPLNILIDELKCLENAEKNFTVLATEIYEKQTGQTVPSEKDPLNGVHYIYRHPQEVGSVSFRLRPEVQEYFGFANQSVSQIGNEHHDNSITFMSGSTGYTNVEVAQRFEKGLYQDYLANYDSEVHLKAP